ncbi:hypothetical protein HYU13_01585 [Candidatus Woesearchaeota archaeon]|nr:hypothetical protein [Candidatus Woesearchaeota archaeon]
MDEKGFNALVYQYLDQLGLDFKRQPEFTNSNYAHSILPRISEEQKLPEGLPLRRGNALEERFQDGATIKVDEQIYTAHWGLRRVTRALEPKATVSDFLAARTEITAYFSIRGDGWHYFMKTGGLPSNDKVGIDETSGEFPPELDGQPIEKAVLSLLTKIKELNPARFYAPKEEFASESGVKRDEEAMTASGSMGPRFIS